MNLPDPLSDPRIWVSKYGSLAELESARSKLDIKRKDLKRPVTPEVIRGTRLLTGKWKEVSGPFRLKKPARCGMQPQMISKLSSSILEY